MTRPAYTTNRTRHTPLRHIHRDGRASLLHGEPMCGALSGPGSTTTVDIYVNCTSCLAALAKEIH